MTVSFNEVSREQILYYQIRHIASIALFIGSVIGFALSVKGSPFGIIASLTGIGGSIYFGSQTFKFSAEEIQYPKKGTISLKKETTFEEIREALFFNPLTQKFSSKRILNLGPMARNGDLGNDLARFKAFFDGITTELHQKMLDRQDVSQLIEQWKEEYQRLKN